MIETSQSKLHRCLPGQLLVVRPTRDREQFRNPEDNGIAVFVVFDTAWRQMWTRMALPSPLGCRNTWVVERDGESPTQWCQGNRYWMLTREEDAALRMAQALCPDQFTSMARVYQWFKEAGWLPDNT